MQADNVVFDFNPFSVDVNLWGVHVDLNQYCNAVMFQLYLQVNP